jgi:hypothetical protein
MTKKGVRIRLDSLRISRILKLPQQQLRVHPWMPSDGTESYLNNGKSKSTNVSPVACLSRIGVKEHDIKRKYITIG